MSGYSGYAGNVLEPNLKDCATFDTSKKGEFNIFTKAGINDDNLTNWYWDFGDGSTSIIQFPVHSYDDYGSYAVSLITVSEYGFDSNPHIEIIELLNLTGDVNNDNAVDILDVIYLVEILLSNTSFSR